MMASPNVLTPPKPKSQTYNILKDTELEVSVSMNCEQGADSGRSRAPDREPSTTAAAFRIGKVYKLVRFPGFST